MAPKAARFWNRMANRYAAQPISDPEAYERKLEITRTFLHPDMSVLEFGCGIGSTAVLHAPLVADYRALDISEKMIEIARAKDGADKVTFEVGDFDAMEYPRESLDAVLGLSILHLVPDPAATIAKVYATLKPGGVFISSTACVANMWLLRVLGPIGQVVGLIPLLAFFSEDDLRDMMRKAGFEIVEDWCPGKGKALFLVCTKRPGS